MTDDLDPQAPPDPMADLTPEPPDEPTADAEATADYDDLVEPEPEGSFSIGAIFGPFFNVIVAPKECWAALDAKPMLSIWIALWIAILMTVTEVIKMPATLPASLSMARFQIEAAGGEVTQQTLTSIAWWTRISTYVFTPIMMFVVIALVAVVMWVLASLMAGKGATFGRSFALASAAGVIKPLLNNVYVAIILRLDPPVIRRPADMTQLQPSLGLDLLLPSSDMQVWIIALLKRVDLFSIWWLALVAAGAVPLLKLSKGQGAALGLVIWFFGTVVAIAFAMLFTS